MMKREMTTAMLCACFSLFSSAGALAQVAAPAFEVISDSAQIETLRADFNKSLASSGVASSFKTCDTVIKLKLEDNGRNASHGAICAFDGPGDKKVLVCDDMMVGLLTVKLFGFSETPEDVATFTRNNCVDG